MPPHAVGWDALQGTAGETNTLTITLVDALGQQYSSDKSEVNLTASLAEYPSSLMSAAGLIGVVSLGEGSVAIQWTATTATPADNSLLYQINVTLASSGQVCALAYNERLCRFHELLS